MSWIYCLHLKQISRVWSNSIRITSVEIVLLDWCINKMLCSTCCRTKLWTSRICNEAKGRIFKTGVTKYAKFSEKRTFLTPWCTRMCPYQGARNVSFWKILRTYLMDDPKTNQTWTNQIVQKPNGLEMEHLLNTG